MLVRVVVFLLTAPWIVLAAVVRAVVGLVRLPRRIQARSADQLFCPDGHSNPVMGRWSCRCGANYLGHAFGPCPVCGFPAGWIRCEVCGLAIRSPWKAN